MDHGNNTNYRQIERVPLDEYNVQLPPTNAASSSHSNFQSISSGSENNVHHNGKTRKSLPMITSSSLTSTSISACRDAAHNVQGEPDMNFHPIPFREAKSHAARPYLQAVNPIDTAYQTSSTTLLIRPGQVNYLHSPSNPLLPSPPISDQNKPYVPEQCVIVQGLTESSKTIAKDRTLDDLTQIQACIRSILVAGDNIDIYKSYRLGKLETGSRPRPIKLILRDSSQVDILIKRKYLLKNKSPQVFFQREYSPREREKHRELIIQLQRRRMNGEKNLLIKDGEIITKSVSFLWENPFTICL
jgi:hypothetical protein